MTIRAGENDDFSSIIVWGPDGHPLSHIFEFDTETCQMMFYPIQNINTQHRRLDWKHPLEYVHMAKAVKFRNTPPDAVDSIIMTLPGAYATKLDPYLGDFSTPDPDAPRIL
jgi:hypothetical protein